MRTDVPQEPVTVLLLERSSASGAALRAALEGQGMRVDETDSADGAVERVQHREPDLVVVEPLVALRVCVDAVARLRSTTRAAVVVLSAAVPPSPGRAAAGAAAVAAGVEAARAVPATEAIRRFGTLCIDLAARVVTTPHGEVPLTRKEMDLLVVLASRAGTVCTREELLEEVWSGSAWHDPATLSEHVHRLRRKVEADPAHPRYILTVRGVGYRFAR